MTQLTLVETGAANECNVLTGVRRAPEGDLYVEVTKVPVGAI